MISDSLGVLPCHKMPTRKIRPAIITMKTVARKVRTIPKIGCQSGIVWPVLILNIMVVGVAGGNSENHFAIEPLGSCTIKIQMNKGLINIIHTGSSID